MDDQPYRSVSDAQVIADSWETPHRFDLIVRRHFSDIYRFAVNRIGANSGEDVAQETFSQAFAVRRRYDLRRKNARPWLFGIAVNSLRAYRRNEKRHFDLMQRSAAGLDNGHGEEAKAIARIDATACRSQLFKGLAALKRRDRETLLLFAWADLSYQEIAEALHIPPGTVRSRINRARRQLDRALCENQVLSDGRSSFTVSEVMSDES